MSHPYPFYKTINTWRLIRKEKRKLAASNWQFSEFRVSMILSETYEWERFYLPIDLRGKVVLDVGAGEGESARFFIEHGAKQVICIEPSDEAMANLEANAKNHPEIKILHKCFDVADLKLPVDFMKMDIEGYEELILGYKPVFPSMVEVHSLYLRDKFEAEGYTIVYPSYHCDSRRKSYTTAYYTAGCYAYWLCGLKNKESFI